MSTLSPIVAVIFIVLVAWMLLNDYYPHAVLLFAGLLMLAIAPSLNTGLKSEPSSTGFFLFDLFQVVRQSFGKTNMGVGLMIMAIGGFVSYIEHIGASKALVDLAMKPLGLLRNYPQLTAVAVIPISQVLFVAIPSAAGLSLLLMASVFPILLNLGVSRLTAVSVITASTAIGLGPASAMTVRASEIIQIPAVDYFVQDQIPLVLPLSLVLAITYYFVNRYFDSKNTAKDEVAMAPQSETKKAQAPGIYALIPVLPIVLLILFSDLSNLFQPAIKLETTTAMFISLFVALTFEFIRHRKLKPVLGSLKLFWNGMGNIFKTVVTLIIAADIFSRGLIQLGLIDGLLQLSNNIGLNAIGIGVVMTIMIFLAAMLMGSGNAAFFAFGPLIPNIAAKFGIKSAFLILPMNFAASMGRTVSPVAGVLIATAEIAQVSALAIVRRNLIPLVTALLVMLIYHFI
jgi:DcuC family C4-dicarboxylate transporter